MKLSARNQLKGTVVEIQPGVVTAKVVLEVGGGQSITSVITMDAVKDLGLRVGAEATAVFKSTSVMLMA